MSGTAEAELDEASAEVWDDWFDVKKTSIADAMKVFRIVTDVQEDDESDDIPDVPFEMRDRQAEILDRCENYFWKLKRRAARLIILKARRFGITTFFRLFGLERILRVPGYQVLLVAQDDTMAEYHFQGLRDALRQIPAAVLEARGIEIVQETKHQVILRHADGKTSAFRVAPAKRNALGRGAQINMLILTEYPNWPISAKKSLSGLLRSCRNVRGNIIAFESTAKGFDDFQRRYDRAEKRKSDYRAMFIASYEHPFNRKPFETAEAETEFIKTIGTLKEYGAEDETVLFRKLTVDLKWTFSEGASFLNWRRATLVDDCEGSLDNLHQEEPNTPTEAFTGTGIPLFNKPMLEAWRPFAQAREDKAVRGLLMLIHEQLIFTPDIRADLTVLERPEEGRRYALGSDVASGIAVLSNGRTEADFSWTCVKDVVTKVTVARLRVHMDPAEFAEQTFRLACWYNAEVFKVSKPFRCALIERSINDAGVCINEFEKCKLDDIDGDELLVGETRLIKTDAANAKASYRFSPGFRTGTKTKPKLVDNIRKEILAAGMAEEGKECPFDILGLDEMMRFERSEVSGRMEAAVGHDDGVIAEGLALEAIEEILKDAPESKKPDPKTESPHQKLLRYAAMEQAQREADGDGEFSAVDGLPGY